MKTGKGILFLFLFIIVIMATAYQNLSDYDFNSVPDASEMNVGIVVAEWNKVITCLLYTSDAADE